MAKIKRWQNIVKQDFHGVICKISDLFNKPKAVSTEKHWKMSIVDIYGIKYLIICWLVVAFMSTRGQ